MVSPRAAVTLLSIILLTSGATGLAQAADGNGSPTMIPPPPHMDGTLLHDDHLDPGDQPSFAFFPDPDAVQASLIEYADHEWVTLHTIGNSTDGRPLVLAEVTDPDPTVPIGDRVVTFIFTQQHGNEPAGTPAALDLLADITSGGPIADTLADQILLLLPMANPDGAAANQRRNAQDLDINRDHIALDSPEARALHKVLNDWDVDVAMDHHEYGGTGYGYPSPLRLYDYDLTTLYPVHGNVRDEVRNTAKDLMYYGIWPKARDAGYSANEYGEQTIAGVAYEQVAGGPDPGIVRNHLGLHHVTGILVETFIEASVEGNDINPFHDAERRTHIHRIVMDATLEYVHSLADHFRDAKAQALAKDHDHPWDHYLEGDTATEMAPAYAAPLANDTLGLFAAHGLPPGHATTDRAIHNIQGAPYAGHAAAILHPASSRAVVDATPTARYALPAPQEETISEASGASLALIALALVGLAGAGRPRNRTPTGPLRP